MPAPLYPLSRNERLNVVDESTPFALAQPAQTGVDDVPIRAGMTLPAAAVELTETDERTGFAGVRDTVEGKIVPSAWSLSTYVTGADAAGTPPKHGLLLKKGFGVETIVGGVSVTYAPADTTSELTCSLWQFFKFGTNLANLARALRGGIVNQIGLSLAGSEPGRWTFQGFAAAELFAGVVTLQTTVDAIATSFVLQSGHGRRIDLGAAPAATDFLYLKIENEIVKVTAVVVDTLTVARGQLGSTAAAHTAPVEIAPWMPAGDPDPRDVIQKVTVGSIDLGALTGLVGIDFTMTLNNNLVPRLDEYAQGAATGFPPSRTRQVTGTLRCYAKQANVAILSDLRRGLEVNAVIKAGVAGSGTALMTLTLPRFKFMKPFAIDTSRPDVAIQGEWQAFETAGNDEATLIYT